MTPGIHETLEHVVRAGEHPVLRRSARCRCSSRGGTARRADRARRRPDRDRGRRERSHGRPADRSHPRTCASRCRRAGRRPSRTPRSNSARRRPRCAPGSRRHRRGQQPVWWSQGRDDVTPSRSARSRSTTASLEDGDGGHDQQEHGRARRARRGRATRRSGRCDPSISPLVMRARPTARVRARSTARGCVSGQTNAGGARLGARCPPSP